MSNGKKVKDWKTYHENGALETETPYYENVINGTLNEFDNKKNLVKSTAFQFNRQSGPVITYYGNGEKQTETNYVNGQKSGRHYEYRENGSVKVKGNHLYDVRQGTWQYFDTQGKITKTETYSRGQLISSTEN